MATDTPDQSPDDDAWIEKVVKLGAGLGMNPMRLRWKLIRWRGSRREARRQLEHRRSRSDTSSA